MSLSEPYALEVCNLSFQYALSTRPVFSRLSWRVPKGSFTLLTGATGSGKSSLLSLLKPEIAPSGRCSGERLIAGIPFEKLDRESSARTVGYVFQNPDNQIVCDTVLRELAFGLENLGVPRAQMRRKIADLCYFFGMESWLHEPCDTLSGGRKQLLALAATLVMQPHILLLDEPTAQLDPIAEKQFLHVLFRSNKELGCTVVVATHKPETMHEYATHMARLVDGHVQEVPLNQREDSEACEDCKTLEGKTLHAAGDVALASRGLPEPLNFQACSVEPVKHKAMPDLVNTATSESGIDLASTDAPVNAAAPTAPAVSLSRAYYRYEPHAPWILRGLDITIQQGCIHALVGGNGCGKSTLLQLIAGAKKLSKGKFTCKIAERALLPQNPVALFACETVYEELMEWSGLGGYNLQAAKSMLNKVQLTSQVDVHPYDLSGGQQQLLALAKLLLMQPRLLVLDEPTKGLDAQARNQLLQLLDQQRTQGTTIVMATHDLAAVRTMADYVSLMFDGEIAATTSGEEFFHDTMFFRPA
ncbi:ABC transporter ATP-binding protein [Collinsella sp. zg1085]|uniref:ABC transporter ATP-binding protein n=1 Tax=Collinsella sp. zg1085 TaxID=2844380 RepID=UPI001C0DF76E|nr:ABC transporter ATP-binding protein [Collinsella sp. zg1085]QWT17533.1 ABC transporter ATP-binding protein [Collinsella sp. zg1085]